MRDHGRAVLVGEKSYGKFSVQQLFPIYQDPQGKNNAVLKLTIAKYFLPKGNSYEQIGISPQVPVTIPPPKNDSPAGNAEHYNLPSPHIPVSVSEPYVAEALKILVDPKLYQEYLKTP